VGSCVGFGRDPPEGSETVNLSPACCRNRTSEALVALVGRPRVCEKIIKASLESPRPRIDAVAT
jgi:hypothetical protein